MSQRQDILSLFSESKIERTWAFADKTRKDTAYITHGYHRYPAKFIPQIASRLMRKYTKEGDLVADPFGGCGTTLIEAKVMGRHSIGVDINPVAVLVAKAKKTPIEPIKIQKQFFELRNRMHAFGKEECKAPEHERIDYWFDSQTKRKLAFLLGEISQIRDEDVRDFFLCGFSNILKSCSLWGQKSNKPIRDQKKNTADPFSAFSRQIKIMYRGNADFVSTLQKRGCMKTPCDVHCADARKVPAKSESVSLIITSPPYVTSYEYADLHQLSALWFGFTRDLSDFRKAFIGTAYHNGKGDLSLNSEIAEGIKAELLRKNRKTAGGVSTYFGEMNQVFGEMKRLLKRSGRVCIVIGDTALKGVKILNAEVFADQLQNVGFEIEDLIKREIPSKNLPSTRDKTTGRFTKTSNAQKVFAYPTEYILVMKKYDNR